MKAMVPEKKMGKKARRELNLARRTTWEFSPVSRVKDSQKKYRRERIRPEEYRSGFFLLSFAGAVKPRLLPPRFLDAAQPGL